MDEQRTVTGKQFLPLQVCENRRVSRYLPLAAMLAMLAVLGAAGCSSAATSAPPGTASPQTSQASQAAIPRLAHVVVVMMENHSFGDVIGSADAPYLTSLAARGADFTSSFAITHPSEPNYLAIFSGSTQGVTSDACPVTFNTPNLAADLLSAGKTFTGYAEDLPAGGASVCTAGEYARKHVPWADFSTVPAAVSKPFSSWPSADYATLPAVSFVIPDLCDDMHDCPVSAGDAWLRTHLDGYARWAMTHDSR